MRRRVVRSLVALIVLAASVAGCSLRRAADRPASPYCRGGDPLAGVYHPQRLEVRSRCRVATGIVTDVKFERFDGDVHIDLRPDDHGTLSGGNDRLGGDLVAEIIPQDRSAVAVPVVGTRVTVVGPWVDDTTHGWREIHPVWWVSAGRIMPATPDELARVRELLLNPVADPD
jgi:hypothetical protein